MQWTRSTSAGVYASAVGVFNFLFNNPIETGKVGTKSRTLESGLVDFDKNVLRFHWLS